MGPHKTENFSSGKDIIIQGEKQPMEKKLFTIHLTEGNTNNIQRAKIDISIKETNKPTKNLSMKFNKEFLEDERQIVEKHLTRCLTSLTVMKIQFKTTLRHILFLLNNYH